MKFLALLAVLVATSSAARVPRQATGPNIVGSILNNFESVRSQFNAISNVLSQLNGQLSQVVQSSVRAVAGLEAEQEESQTQSQGEVTTTPVPETTTPGLPATSAPEAPSTPAMPGTSTPAIPTQPSTPAVPAGVPSQNTTAPSVPVPETPAVPSVPGAPSTVAPPAASGVPSAQNATAVPSAPSTPATPSAPGVPSAQNATTVPAGLSSGANPSNSSTVPGAPAGTPGLDLGGAVMGSVRDVLQQFGNIGRTLTEVSNQFNQLVQTGSRLITGLDSEEVVRSKRQLPGGNPLEIVSTLLSTLSRQATDLSSQVTGLLGGLGNFGGQTGQQQGNSGSRGNGNPLGGLTDIAGNIGRLVGGGR